MDNDLNAWRDDCSAEYLAAYDAHNFAIGVFQTEQIAYRAGVIGDADFLAARAVYMGACAAYDAAYAIEQACGRG